MKSSLRNNVDAASHVAEDAKSHTARSANPSRSTFIEYGTQALKMLRSLHLLESDAADSVLGLIGLRRRTSGVMRPIVWFTAGAMVGGGAMLALSPSTAKEVRQRLARWIDGGRADVDNDAKRSEGKASSTVGGTNKQAMSKANSGVEASPEHLQGSNHETV